MDGVLTIFQNKYLRTDYVQFADATALLTKQASDVDNFGDYPKNDN